MQERKGLFNPKQLTSARVSRGMTMKELSEKAEISRQMISNYESGKTIPKAENLLKLINVLGFPRGFFSAEMSDFHSGATFFRSQTATTKKARDMQKEKIKYTYDVYSKLATFVNFPPVNLPSLIEKDIHDIHEEDIIQKANELRSVWGIDSISPIKNLIAIAEKNGIIIAEANMTDTTLDAVSRWVIDRPFIILTNNNEPAVRRRFNIAHEIGHILLHNGVESIHAYSSKELKNIIEKQANSFASHFLLPSDAFEESLLSTSLEYFIDLKKHWKVSIQAMIYKTYSLELINDDQYLYLNKKISWNKWRSKEPYDDEIPVEKPNLMNAVYNMIVENNVMFPNELIGSFNLPQDELEKIISKNIFKTEDSKTSTPILRLIE